MTVDRAAPAEGARLRRPRWRDPRLLVGLVLVLASVAGVVALLAAAQRTQTYWVAARDIAPGTPVDAAAFVPAEAQLGDAAGLYLTADHPAPAGQVVGAVVRRGELVPAGVMAPADPARRRPRGGHRPHRERRPDPPGPAVHGRRTPARRQRRDDGCPG